MLPAKEAAAAQVQQEFQTDPQLLEAARGYATCLRGRGYDVTIVKPGAIEHARRRRSRAGSADVAGPGT